MAPSLPTEVLPYSYLQYLLMGYWSKTLSCCPELSFCPKPFDVLRPLQPLAALQS